MGGVTEEKSYWLACYPDRVFDAESNGLGSSHFVPAPGGPDEGYDVAFLILETPHKAAAMVKDIRGRRFVGKTDVIGDDGKTYSVPNYDVFDRVTCVRISVPDLPEHLSPSLFDGPIPGTYRLRLSSPEIPLSCVIDSADVSLSDPAVPDIDDLLLP